MMNSKFSQNNDPQKQNALKQWGEAHAQLRLNEWPALDEDLKKELMRNSVHFAKSIGADVEDLRASLGKALYSEPSARKNKILGDFWVDFMKAHMRLRDEELGVFKTEQPDRSTASQTVSRGEELAASR